MNVVDWIIVIVLALGAVQGYRRGLLNTVAGIFSYIVGFVLALTYAGNLARFFEREWGVIASFAGWLEKVLPLPEFGQAAEESPSSAALSYLEGLPLPAFLQQKVILRLQEQIAAGQEALGSLSAIVAEEIAAFLIQALAFIIILFVSVAVVKGLTNLLTRGINFTPLRGINRLAGLLAGAGVKALIIMLILGLISPLLALKSSQEAGAGILGYAGEKLDGSLLVPLFLEWFATVSDWFYTSLLAG